MANSLKHKTTAFEIQTRDKHTVTAPPPPHPPSPPSAPRTTIAISCIYSYQKKGLLQLTLGNPLLLNWNIQS